MGYLIITAICWTWLMITVGYKLGKRAQKWKDNQTR